MKIIIYFLIFGTIGVFNISGLYALDSDPGTINGAEGGNGWSSGGGGFHRGVNNIWYLGDRSVQYCIGSDPSYPLELEKLEEMVKQGLNEWGNFFKKYKLDKESVSLNFSRRFVPLIQKKLKPSLKFEYIGVCPKDNQKINERLHFLFGVKHKVVESFKKVSSENSLGLAIRKKYNHSTLRNGGLIWISSDLKGEKRIKHLLLHELGHVFGMRHDSVFVMNEDVAYELRDNESLGPEYFGKIESPSWVYRLLSGDKLILTNGKGVKKDHKCPKDFIPNKTLPPFIRKSLHLIFSECHKIVLSFRNLTSKNKKYELKFMAPEGVKLNLSGLFEPINPQKMEHFGPGVFTYWQRANGTGGRWDTGVLDNHPPGVPAKGSFSNDLMNIGGMISQNKGIKIDLYFPQIGKWWSLKTIHSKK